MRKRKKIILTVILFIILAIAGYAFYIWNKPARDVAKETGIQITAVAIFDSFSNNEQSANMHYLNKAIEVTGKVTEVKKNQDSATLVYLQSSDPMFGVNCTFKNDPGPIAKGSTITFKGVCTGYLGDVDEPGDVIIDQGILIK